MDEYYAVLGLNSDASEQELKARYEELKAKYKEDRFLPGEEGNRAAMKLNELEEAWQKISDKLESSRYSDDYERIAKTIKEKNYDKAQELLDEIVDRPAKWHFYQSQVYYYREWLVECRKQLTVAIDMDPSNEQYKTALEKLDTVMGNSKKDPHDVHVDGDDIDAARAQAGQAQANEMNTLSNCCTAYCLTSLCCDTMSCCCR